MKLERIDDDDDDHKMMMMVMMKCYDHWLFFAVQVSRHCQSQR